MTHPLELYYSKLDTISEETAKQIIQGTLQGYLDSQSNVVKYERGDYVNTHTRQEHRLYEDSSIRPYQVRYKDLKNLFPKLRLASEYSNMSEDDQENLVFPLYVELYPSYVKYRLTATGTGGLVGYDHRTHKVHLGESRSRKQTPRSVIDMNYTSTYKDYLKFMLSTEKPEIIEGNIPHNINNLANRYKNYREVTRASGELYQLLATYSKHDYRLFDTQGQEGVSIVYPKGLKKVVDNRQTITLYYEFSISDTLLYTAGGGFEYLGKGYLHVTLEGNLVEGAYQFTSDVKYSTATHEMFVKKEEMVHEEYIEYFLNNTILKNAIPVTDVQSLSIVDHIYNNYLNSITSKLIDKVRKHGTLIEQ